MSLGDIYQHVVSVLQNHQGHLYLRPLKFYIVDARHSAKVKVVETLSMQCPLLFWTFSSSSSSGICLGLSLHAPVSAHHGRCSQPWLSIKAKAQCPSATVAIAPDPINSVV